MKAMRFCNRVFAQLRPLGILLIAVTLIGSGPSQRAGFAAPAGSEVTVSLQTTGAPFLQGTFQPVSAAQGNQFNPHVDCDLASYTYDDFQGSSTIHYQNLSTGVDNVIPGNQVDLLSHVSGNRIAFTEVDFAGETVVVFDTLTQTRTVVPGYHRSSPSIGGNFVAFEDGRNFQTNEGEVGIFDLSTGAIAQLTNDSLDNRFISVSPNGDALVWEKCQLDQLGCDIYAALQTSPDVFSTRPLTVGGGEDRWPHTDGELAVYVSNRSGENDIYYQPVTGGTEVHLAIPGDQRDPTISGNLISFESQDSNGSYDIFVYDLRTSRLFQVTDTSPFDETLSDLSVCNGVGRIIYAIPGNDFDVHSFTFQVPNTAEGEINDLIATIRSFKLAVGTTNSLVVKLQDVLAAFSASDSVTACSALTDFVNDCQAQGGKKLTVEQSQMLVTAANQIRADLGCP